jgi:hypothetical protein
MRRPEIFFAGALGGKDASYAKTESELGLNMSLLTVEWSRAQPSHTRALDVEYICSLKDLILRYQSDGMHITLDPGLHYAPSWVFSLDGGSRFVNQYGDIYYALSASGENVPDAVYNPSVQQAQLGYLQGLGDALGRDTFSALRVGGLLTGELRYPRGSYEGHEDCWWVFSKSAQAASPVPGYKPGISQHDKRAESSFISYYLSSIVRYQDFLASAFSNSFDGAVLEFLYPSYGIRPDDVVEALANQLAPSGVRMSEIYQGTDFAALINQLPFYAASASHMGPMMAYTTWLDGPSFGSSARKECPVAYIASLAKPLGISVAGENTQSSRSDPVAMDLCISRVKQYGLMGIMWFNEESLFSEGIVSAAKLADGLGLSRRATS